MVVFNDLIVNGVLPFLLMFVLVFAVLQKSKILGADKNQIDALVALVLAFMFVAVPGPQRDIVLGLMPWLAVALSVMLVFFILYGFVAGDLSGTNMNAGIKWTLVGLAALFTVILVFSLTNLDRLFAVWFTGASDWFVSAVVFLLVIGALAWVVIKAD
ncbi:MAG: hypothetical protein ACI83O_000753 [Patescibacteria group bacterium]|jgi:hypothetical protein